MAIALAFNFLVIRKTAISEKYPGGIEQFRKDWLKPRPRRAPTGEDDHLFGFYSMGSYYQDVVDRLFEVGILDKDGTAHRSVARGDQIDGFYFDNDWLKLDEYYEDVNGKSGFLLCSLVDHDLGEVVEAYFR